MTEISKERMIQWLNYVADCGCCFGCSFAFACEDHSSPRHFCETMRDSIRALIESSPSGDTPSGEQPAPLAVDESDWPAGTFAEPAPPDEKVSCSRCGGSGYARGGEEKQISCRTCSGSGIVLRQSAPKVKPEVDNSGHPQAKERDRLDKFLITMMCHVKEVYEANGTPWGEDDEERFVAIRSLILEMHNNISRVSVQKPASDALRGWRAVLVERGLWHEWDEECFKNIINAEEK